MQFWAGRPLLGSADPVAVAVGLRWVAAAFEEAGLPLHLADSDETTVATFTAAGVDGLAATDAAALDAWLVQWVGQIVARDAAESAQLAPVMDSFLRGWERQRVGMAVVRCLDLIASPSSRGLLNVVRHRERLSVADAAARAGVTARQWSHAEMTGSTFPSSDVLAAVEVGFGFEPGDLPTLLATGHVVPVRSELAACPFHAHSWPALALASEALWFTYDAVVDASLAPGACTAMCPAGCGRRYAIGTDGLYLLPVSPDGPTRERPRGLAHYVAGLD